MDSVLTIKDGLGITHKIAYRFKNGEPCLRVVVQAVEYPGGRKAEDTDETTLGMEIEWVEMILAEMKALRDEMT